MLWAMFLKCKCINLIKQFIQKQNLYEIIFEIIKTSKQPYKTGNFELSLFAFLSYLYLNI